MTSVPIPRITAVQVSAENWIRGDYVPIAVLRHTAGDLGRRLNVKFDEGIEDGLGPFRAAGFQLPNGRQFSLIQYLKAPVPGTTVNCLRDEKFFEDFEDVLESLDMDLSDLAVQDSKPAIFEGLKLVPHALWRQDDIGVRVQVEVFRCRADATKRMREFEAAGHKQTYWVEPQPIQTFRAKFKPVRKRETKAKDLP